MQDVVKVVFLGMDNAGKTTILNILSQKYGLLAKTSPTKAIERRITEMFGCSIVNWDVPGQQQFREALTFQDSRTLKDADVIIFVIDVQDRERTVLALDYFDRLLRKIEDESPKVPYIGVFIHKLDPDIQNAKEVVKNSHQIRKDVNDIAIGYNVDFYLTTMFLEPTIFIGFSNIVLRAISEDKKDNLNRILQYISEKLLLNAILVLEKDFIISSYEKTPNSLKVLQDFAYNLIASYKNAKAHNLDLDEFKLSQKDQTIVLLPILMDDTEIFVVASSARPDLSITGEQQRFLTALKEALQ